ncbi:hypothetical protein GCM10010531_14890 [Blastococcus jejuensis]|uniref:Uncharacterized protein n=1 Tax=Blastococcus jejuensis TaxID=351224 RepID=A0ABP6P0R2_9ACTN
MRRRCREGRLPRIRDRQGRRSGRRASGCTPGGHAPGVPGADHGQIALPVGAVDLHPCLPEPAQRPGRRVAVGVVGTHRDQRDPGTARGEEARIGVAAAVVRHLEHIRPQVGAVPSEPGLGLGPQVAGEQQRDPAGLGTDDQGQVVGRCAGGGLAGVRREHFQGHLPDRAAVTRHQRDQTRSGRPHERLEVRHPVVRG